MHVQGKLLHNYMRSGRLKAKGSFPVLWAACALQSLQNALSPEPQWVGKPPHWIQGCVQVWAWYLRCLGHGKNAMLEPCQCASPSDLWDLLVLKSNPAVFQEHIFSLLKVRNWVSGVLQGPVNGSVAYYNNTGTQATSDGPCTYLWKCDQSIWAWQKLRNCWKPWLWQRTHVAQHRCGAASSSWKCWGAHGGMGRAKGVLQFPLFYNFIFLLWKNHHEGSDKGSQNYLMCREWGPGVWGVCELCFWQLFLA